MGFEGAAGPCRPRTSTAVRATPQRPPLELLDAIALLGPPQRIAERIGRYADAGVTTLSVAPHAWTPEGRAEVLRVVAESLRSSGVAST